MSGTGPKIGFSGWIRWFWRQLITMRTALILLILVALGALPGSIFPQRSTDLGQVETYLQQHPDTGPWLDKLSMFNVYSSPWFAALYLLLMVSLIGCIVPRVAEHYRAWKAGPVPTPRRLAHFAAYEKHEITGTTPEEWHQAAREVLAGPWWRRSQVRSFTAGENQDNAAPTSAESADSAGLTTENRAEKTDTPRPESREEPGYESLSAEGGMWREVGNIVFHIAFVGLIIAVGIGHIWGWRGDVIVPVGQTFTSQSTRYDTLSLGPAVEAKNFAPWSLRMDSLQVRFEDQVPLNSKQFGQARDFTSQVTITENGATRTQRLAVNHPVSVHDTSVLLLGNGYAPKVIVRDAQGKVLYSQATPFLPQNAKYKSTGAIKVSGASPKQLGFYGYLLPTAYFSAKTGPESAFPDARHPMLVLGLYQGNLFPAGRPQSVYTLDTKEMTQVMDGSEPLRLTVRLGETVTLPNNLGSITFAEIPRWAGLSVRVDPGETSALLFGLLALLGMSLSFMVRRRRYWMRMPTRTKATSEHRDGQAFTIEIAALSKGEDPRLAVALSTVFSEILRRSGGTARDVTAQISKDEKPINQT